MNSLVAISFIERSLANNGFTSYKAETRLILEHVLAKPFYQIGLEPKPLNHLEIKNLESILKRRLTNEPLQYILGEIEFYGINLKLNPSVLIPRVETESLVTELIKLKPKRLLDLGTGSGAIAIAVKANCPNTSVLATDISQNALELAQENARAKKLDIEFALSDLLENKAVQSFAKDADVIAANLPYLPLADKASYKLLAFEPSLALFSGQDGLDLFRRFEQQIFSLIKPNALVFCELDPRNIELAFELGKAWGKREIILDILGRKRFLKLSK